MAIEKYNANLFCVKLHRGLKGASVLKRLPVT